MKQSCIARQCLAPVLPHTACCSICGRDGWEKLNIDPSLADETASSLMECSQCWEIVHPYCLSEKQPDLFRETKGFTQSSNLSLSKFSFPIRRLH